MARRTAASDLSPTRARPTPAPDRGRRLAFLRGGGGRKHVEPGIRTLDTAGPPRAGPGASGRHESPPAWSRDGRQLSYARGRSLCSVESLRDGSDDRTRNRQVTSLHSRQRRRVRACMATDDRHLVVSYNPFPAPVGFARRRDSRRRKRIPSTRADHDRPARADRAQHLGGWHAPVGRIRRRGAREVWRVPTSQRAASGEDGRAARRSDVDLF